MCRSVSLIGAIFYFFISSAAADWICPIGNKYCFQWINEPPRTWNETRARCAQLGGDLPGADHLHVLSHALVNEYPFWTSLCFSNGRLQWLGTISYEERNLAFIDTFLPGLTTLHDVDGKMYCFHTNGNMVDPLTTFGLSLKDSQHLIGSMCVSDYRFTQSFIGSTLGGHLISASVIAEGTDIDWGPIRQNREGFVNIFPLQATSLKLKCVVQTTNDAHKSSVRVKWIRNNGYLGNFSQVRSRSQLRIREVSFSSAEDLIPWIGFINCEASYLNHQPVYGQGIHLVVWNTVTARLISTCISCKLQSIIETAKIILAQFVEIEITPGKGTAMEFYIEPPVIHHTTISFMIHIKNKKIDKFDFRMVQKLGNEFQLSRWAKSRSLFLPNDSDLVLEIISPCNMASPQDRQNTTWIGYLGQTVPSGNFIGGPICVNNHGDIVTRTARCGLSDLRPIPHEDCFSMKIRREDPKCFSGFDPADGKCYRMTEASDFATAVAKCWVGWPIQPEILLPDSISNWVQTSREWIYRTHYSPASLVWLPLRRVNNAAPLQTPVWSWNTMSNRWIHMANDWNTTVESSDVSSLCAAYDLGRNKLISTSCQNHLPMICSRPLLSQPLSSAQSGDVGEYFCDPGWLTHWLVLDTGVCYKRFTLKEAIDADEAQKFCVKRGGHLADAPTHSTRLALEQVYSYFNNRSVVDSWIGLRNQNDQPGTFSWVNETAGGHSTKTYNWHPYNEFSDGYASAFRNGMWWNWPRHTKLWGLVCQKNASDWKDGIRLLLEPSNDPIREGEYALVFTYESKPILRDENDDYITPAAFETKKLLNRSYLTKSFWLSDFDVVCHFTNYVRRFSFPRGFRRQYRALVPVSTAMGSGPFTCEAWFNKPAFRFQSNTIIHRPAHWYNFVIVVSKQNLLYPGYRQSSEINWNGESAVNDLLQRMNLNRFRYFKDFMTNFSVATISVEQNQNNATGTANIINYLVSFFLSPDVQRFDLFANIRQCQAGWDFNAFKTSALDYESILHLLLQFCLPLVYRNGEDYQFIAVRSTVACPPIHPPETFGYHFRDETSMAINRFAWPMTNINRMTRSTNPCLIEGHIVRRSCTGSFEQGAIWGPPKIVELNKILDEATTICQVADYTENKMYQLERLSMAAAVDGLSSEAVLTELLKEWDEQPYLSMASLELTISSLRQILNRSRNETAQLNRLLVTTVIERMLRPGKCPLTELQYLPDVLEDLIQLFSDLPALDNKGSRVRVNIGDQVSVVADGIDTTFGNQHFASEVVIDFNRLSVTIQKDAENTVLSTVVALLPSELLAIDPVTKNSIIDLYKVDASDRTQRSILGKFIASQTIVHVNLKSVVKTSTTLFMLALKSDGPSSPGSTFLCARWDSRLNEVHGGWLTGDCWYLGTDEAGTHLCQCYSSGIYGLFHSDEDRTLRLALIRRLPIVINVILFLFMTSCLIIRSAFVCRKAVREMDLVELGARLQLVIAWLTMLFCHLGQYFAPGQIVGCIILTTLFQFFLTAAFFWNIILLVVRRWQIHQRWISNQHACLAKLSFAVWALSSIIVVTIPIYKWKYVHAKLKIISECWIEDPIDFGLTVAIVCLASLVSFVLNVKNLCDQREFGVASDWNASDVLGAVNTPLMCVTGLLAISDNSWLHSTSVAITFSFTSSLLGLIWLCTFWTLVANPTVKHEFQHSNRKIGQDLQLKTIYGSTIEYLTDR